MYIRYKLDAAETLICTMCGKRISGESILLWSDEEKVVRAVKCFPCTVYQVLKYESMDKVATLLEG